MIVKKQKENTVQIVGAINTVSFSEYCYSYLGKYILAPFGEKFNRNRKYLRKISKNEFSKERGVI